MAKLSSDRKSVTVQRGDTLSQIALTYLGSASKYKQLAALNGIKNPNLIYVGQVIKLYGTASGSSSSSPPQSSSPGKPKVTQFGIQSNSENTIFAVWAWSYPNTESFEAEWTYNTGDSVYFLGSRSNVSINDLNSTWNIPDNAKNVRFRVRAVPKNISSTNGNTTQAFTSNWSDFSYWNTDNNPPKVPPVPTVEIKDLKLTAEVVNLEDVKGTQIEFQVVRDNSITLGSSSANIQNIVTARASFQCDVMPGSKYKVRCRTCKGRTKSDWSQFSSNLATEPGKVKLTTCKANKRASDGALYIYLEWTIDNAADTYEIEYTTDKAYFDNPTGSTTKIEVDKAQTKLETFGLELGHEYFFRIRAKNSAGESDWSDILSVPLGENPAAPTTWSSTTTATVGDPLTLYWVHNAKDGSSQTWAELYVEEYINGVLDSHWSKTIENTHDPEEKDKTSFYTINTALYREGVQLRWRVRTSGVTEGLGEWSIIRMVDIYAKPTLQLTITDSEGNRYQNGASIEAISAFPIKIHALAAPETQSPIGYHLSVTSNNVYETVDSVGKDKTVGEGEIVYSKYFDIFTALDVELTASDLDLEDGINYTIDCIVAMNSGLSTSASVDFNVSWIDEVYKPNAVIAIDDETLVAYIRPYCEQLTTNRCRVVYNNVEHAYTTTTEPVSVSWGNMLPETFTVTGEQVFQGLTELTITEDGSITGGDEVYYYELQNSTLVDDITLSVYRREFDGSFTELGTKLDNTRNTFITDPHPSLDLARYRIVAITNSTGAVSFYDIPGVPVGGKSVVIQWSEQWTKFDTDTDDELVEPPWAGSMLKLPYNIDVSDKYNMDVELVEYAGRKRPVSYYGTQLGESATWRVDIDKKDEDTLYALRRLAIWPGDVYVREPSGSGYWANITVSFSQTHKELVIPVSLDIKRVEGGV